MAENNTPQTLTIPENVAQIRERIRNAAQRVGRLPQDIHLIAVSKSQPAERISEAVTEGVFDFGENYIQEARTKIPLVHQQIKLPINWHFIGHLQSNKAKYVVELFSLVHTVDNYQLAQELSKVAQNKDKQLNLLIQVNLSGEAHRAGVSSESLTSLWEQIVSLPNLNVQGLMGMPPMTQTSEEARPYFRQMYHLWETLPTANRHILSMGMSGDFEVAIEEGATHVRIGTALFGKRSPVNG
jgi:hypothetical protein